NSFAWLFFDLFEYEEDDERLLQRKTIEELKGQFNELSRQVNRQVNQTTTTNSSSTEQTTKKKSAMKSFFSSIRNDDDESINQNEIDKYLSIPEADQTEENDLLD
ncbi:17574_t:CDS:2, partial [Cetraspora pellucida]